MEQQFGDEEEPVECTECGESPTLYYSPTSDEPLRLRCGCDLRMADVTDDLNQSNLLEPLTGSWTNFDYDSTMRYDDR